MQTAAMPMPFGGSRRTTGATAEGDPPFVPGEQRRPSDSSPRGGEPGPELPTLLCHNRHPVEKLKVSLRRYQGLVSSRKCSLCGATINRHESHWRCEHHCDYNVCQGCFGSHWKASLADAACCDSPSGLKPARVLRALPPPLRGCGLYAEIAGRWGLDVPHPLGLVLHRVWNVPGSGELDLFVLAEAVNGDTLLCKAQSYIVSSTGEPVWDQVLTLPASPRARSGSSGTSSPKSGDRERVSPDDVGHSKVVGGEGEKMAMAPPEMWDLERTSIRFTLYEVRLLLPTVALGQCVVPLLDLLRRPVSKWMLFDNVGNAALGATPPHMPCELAVSVVQESLPACWPKPKYGAKPMPANPTHNGTNACPPTAMPEGEPERYPHHAFIMTRGTRGDVQPFIALARGLAELRGWMVTLCTELRWKDMVGAHSHVQRGRIRFRPSGGDTEARLHGRTAQLLLRSKNEVLQMLALSHSQESCFPSASVFIHHVLELEQEARPVDVVIFGLTVIDLAVLVSQRCQKPIIGFILQPSIIPSKDEQWRPVAPIACKESRGGILQGVPILQGVSVPVPRAAVTSHESLKVMKDIAEHNPFARWNIDSLRRLFGLEPLDTWEALREQNIPLIVPMQEGTFERPSDWWPRIQLTDFIFLRGPSKEGQDKGSSPAPPSEVRGFFEAARAAGAKVGLMTFSSMPVPRRAVLQCAIRMVEECQHNFRLLYVGPHEEGPPDLEARAAVLRDTDRLLELERADFGTLFPHADCFIVHGGLGTTVEALRSRKPVCVTGPLLLDQRFWGSVCFRQGVGPEPVHIDEFEASCVAFVDGALDPEDPEGWQKRARELEWSTGDGDGVAANVDCIAGMLEEGLLPLRQRA